MEYKEYGHWSADGKEYVITERKTPRHWYNYFFNDTYISFASQVGFGEGFCQDDMGRRVPLVTDRSVYLCDKEQGTWHTACGLPMSEVFDRYECHHGIGYSTILCEKNGIRSEYTVFVPTKGDFEVWILRVTNLRPVCAKLSAIAYAATDCDGKYTPQGYNSFLSGYEPESRAVCIRATSAFESGKKQMQFNYMICSETPIGYDTRKSAFIGTYGSKDTPEALLMHNGCTNSSSCTEKACFALEADCVLSAGESKTLSFSVGHSVKHEDIAALSAIFTAEHAQALLAKIQAKRWSDLDGVTIETPDQNLNFAFNGFYKYAANMGSRWARVRHNGYRDMASDTECFGSFNPTMAWERFKRILTYQYSNGYCPRTFIDGAIKPNNFSDCAVWIIFTAYSLVMELGKKELLDEEIVFNDGTRASVFEHLRRAVDYLYNFQGMHGLIKIWGGDWNDGMNGAGLEGKGVSIWLSIAWYRANKQLMELAVLIGRKELLPVHRQMGEDMREKIDTYGWDGAYYITAINDKGEKIGSKESKEGNMYLNPQLWAVFSELAPKERLQAILEEVDRNLETPLGTLVNNPGYTAFDPYIGSMTSQPIGTLINRAVYLHPMAWKLAAEGMMKRPEKLQMTLEKILPWNHKHAPTCGEPYILYNFYHGPETEYRYGTPGQSWRTATTQWVVKALIQFVFGLKPCIEGLRIDPCLPPDWKDCRITKTFRNCTYEITYRQEKQDGSIQLSVDGAPIEGVLLPYRNEGYFCVTVTL